jgi:hypothetical protein
MSIQPDQLAALMAEVEQEDPIDFADLPYPEDQLRQLVACHLCEMARAMENFSNEDRLLTLLAVAARLVLENLVLHIRLLRQPGAGASTEADLDALLARLRKQDGAAGA